MSETPLGYVLGGVATFLASAGLFLIQRWVEPKSKIVWWAPRENIFQLPIPAPNKQESDATTHDVPNTVQVLDKLNVIVMSIFMQNVGRKRADAIEICFASRPQHLKLFPSRDYKETTTPDGAYVLTIESLSPKEVVAVECFALGSLPAFNYVRTGDQLCERITFFYQRILPNWLIYAYNAFALIGLGFVITCLILALLRALGVLNVPIR